MKIRIPFIFTIVLFLASFANAQTTTATLEWSYDVALSEVQTYAQQVTVNTNIITTIPTCVATSAIKTTCNVTIPALNVGSNVVAIAATRNGMTAETRITGIDPNLAPKNANAPKAKIVITINIGG